MRLTVLPLVLVLSLPAANALRFKAKQIKRSSNLLQRRANSPVTVSQSGKPSDHLKVLAAGASTDDDDSLNLNTYRDLLYIANVTLGGVDYPIQLDTGSSDFWIKGMTSPLPNTTQTSTTYNLTYGIGWAYGTVSFASLDFADLSVPSQAYLDVSDAKNPALAYHAQGVLGLGFTSLSTIDALMNQTNSAQGRNVLYNLFAAHPNEPNFIAFALQRDSDGDSADDVEGSFSIGEYEDEYVAVKDAKKLPTWPEKSPTRWNVLLDSFVVGETTVFVNNSVDGAPLGQAVVLMDSGTSWTYAPTYVCDAIYKGVEGAVYDSGLQQWRVPCNTEIDMALQFGNEMYPIHPLDVVSPSLLDPTICTGTFVPQNIGGGGEYDWLVGDNVLRSMYSVYDFGDFDASGKMGDPYVQLLSIVDPNNASAEFAKTRGSTARTGITYTVTPSNTTSAGAPTLSLSANVESILDNVTKYLPAIAAVLGLNALVCIGLLLAATLLLCRRRRSSPPGGSGARPRSTLAPRSMAYSTYGGGPEHQYEPVSMAFTDDAGYKYDPEAAAAKRPASAYSSAAPQFAQAYPPPPAHARAASTSAMSYEDPYRPPAPAFRQGGSAGGDRPVSVA